MTDAEITPEVLLHAYRAGVFPMADAADAAGLYWVRPRFRGVFGLNDFHISRSLKKRILSADISALVNRDFAGVVAACADRPTTWINGQITELYQNLHEMGHAHCLEISQNGVLIGGVYGVAIGGAFFGESMFSRATDGSKIALAYLVHRLRAGGFVLFDTQYLTPHLASLGAIEIPRAVYDARLAHALTLAASFTPDGYCPVPASVASTPSAG